MSPVKDIKRRIIDWASTKANVRAAILTSSRANPHATVDFLSDYDVELIVDDLSHFTSDDAWASVFGVIIARWPYKPRETDLREGSITRLFLFEDGNRIDFQITDRHAHDTNLYDLGYEVLIDKDDILAAIPAPTYSAYNIAKPSQEEFRETVSDFWWDATYVPKYLWRDQLPFAKYMMSCQVQHRILHRMIEWYIGCRNGWSVNSGIQGRYFKRYLEPETWRAYQSTYAGAGINESWEAFFNAVELFTRIARYIAESLGYPYSEETEAHMRKYYRRIRAAQ